MNTISLHDIGGAQDEKEDEDGDESTDRPHKVEISIPAVRIW